MTDIKAIVLDFDGVITVRGEALKRDAWKILADGAEFESSADKKLFSKHLLKNVAAHREGKLKGSRFEILKATLHEFGFDGKTADEKVAEYAKRYDETVQTLISEEGAREGTAGALKNLSERLPLFVNSATPEEAVLRSLKRLKLDSFFKGIYGQPKNKTDILESIARERNINPKEIVFVGDTDGDRKAAEKFGCRFVGFANDWNKWGDSEGFPVIRGLSELLLPLTKSA